MTEPITIGVDHGYAAMKTAHCSFPSGLAEYEHEPYTQKNVLCYDGKYYVVGSGRQPLQQDKTVDENYYLLTLAAIAKEIAYRNAPTTTSVILAAGLPLTSFGREKKAFRAYLLREGKPVSFSYIRYMQNTIRRMTEQPCELPESSTEERAAALIHVLQEIGALELLEE